MDNLKLKYSSKVILKEKDFRFYCIKDSLVNISINNSKSNEILTVLKMAIAKYGNELDITGTEDFKREVIKTVKSIV